MTKARHYPIQKINVNLFTDLMKMHLSVALTRYEYIMNEFNAFKNRPYDPDDDFVLEFENYYGLKASAKDFGKQTIKDLFFNLLISPSKSDPDGLAVDFANLAKQQNIQIGHHLSFCSKICHTNNPNKPIYDSRIAEYLKDIYGIPKTYNGIKNWFYQNDPRIKSDQSAMLSWFRNNFPRFSNIGDIKVLDTIIFIWHKYK